MDSYLYKYLVLEKHLCLPQLGSFVVRKEPARYDGQTGTLYPPAETIEFSDGVIPVSEKLFFDFLAGEMGVDTVTAIKQFHDFSYAFRTHLSELGWAELQGVGRLVKQETGSLVFEPAPRLADLYPVLQDDLPATFATEESISEEETIEPRKDNWWIYALILLLLGAGALLFYYS